jgi:hypothetical protein
MKMEAKKKHQVLIVCKPKQKMLIVKLLNKKGKMISNNKEMKVAKVEKMNKKKCHMQKENMMKMN